MPYKKEHAARIIDPDEFIAGSIYSFYPPNTTGIRAIIGRLKKTGTTSTQAYRFDKTKYSPAQAKEWLKKHKIKPKEFHPALKD